MKKSRGFSLIEVMVSIVVFSVGVLAVLRIYGPGFVALSITRDYNIAQGLARRSVDYLTTRGEDLPKQILAVRYQFVEVSPGNWQLLLVSDPDVSPDELGPGGNILQDGTVEIVNPGGGGNAYIFWRYYNDANRTRRIIAEGGTIPAPKAIGNQFGSLRLLGFGPVVDDPNLLLVYSNDMSGMVLQDTSLGAALRNPRPWNFQYDNDNNQIWLPGANGRDISYKINFSYWADIAGEHRKVDIIDLVVTVRSGIEYDTTTDRVIPFDLQALAGSPPNWDGLVPDSISVNRLFDPIPVASAFDPSYPYEYKVLNGEIGMLLFNPVGYQFQERRGRERIPLVAQVNYDVFNWHVLREDFQVFRANTAQHKLPVERIKAFNDMQNDKRRYQGLQLAIPDGLGGFDMNRDVVVIDTDTGGVVSPYPDPSNPTGPRCYRVDYLRGVVLFGSPVTSDSELSTTITQILPDGAQTVVQNIDPRGRNFRVYYQAHNDWAVQIQKPSSNYSIALGLPLSVGQCFIGGTPGFNVGDPWKIYFPRCDVGMKVAIREIWYLDSFGGVKAMRDQNFIVRPDSISGFPDMGSINIREADATAVAFDWDEYGYAARGVAGTTIRARVIWNTAQREDVPGDTPADIFARMQFHDAWGRNWRAVKVETYLTRRDTR